MNPEETRERPSSSSDAPVDQTNLIEPQARVVASADVVKREQPSEPDTGCTEQGQNDRLDLILDEICRFVRRYVVLTGAQQAVIALWVAHTHAFEAAETTPYLEISSAEKESGKTRLLETLELLVAKPWFTGRMSTSALAPDRCGAADPSP